MQFLKREGPQNQDIERALQQIGLRTGHEILLLTVYKTVTPLL
jgi:hypothetical protein